MTENSLDAVTLVDVGDIQYKENGQMYFAAKFRKGLVGRLVTRHLWGRKQEDGSILWHNISFEDALRLRGQDLAGHVDIIGVGIKPEPIKIDGEPKTDDEGKSYLLGQRSVVVFSDENLEQAILRSGSTPDCRTIQVIVHHHVKVVSAPVELPQE